MFSFFKSIVNTDDAIMAAELTSKAVNSFSFQTEKEGDTILKEPKLRRSFLPYAYAWMAQLSAMYKHGRYDGRNEAACKTAWDLKCHFPAFREEVEDWARVTTCKAFNTAMEHEHKTLQQTFSGLCLYVITQDLLEKNSAHMETLGEIGYGFDFWNLPLI